MYYTICHKWLEIWSKLVCLNIIMPYIKCYNISQILYNPIFYFSLTFFHGWNIIIQENLSSSRISGLESFGQLLYNTFPASNIFRFGQGVQNHFRRSQPLEVQILRNMFLNSMKHIFFKEYFQFWNKLKSYRFVWASFMLYSQPVKLYHFFSEFHCLR